MGRFPSVALGLGAWRSMHQHLPYLPIPKLAHFNVTNA
eukprot:COSAG05_NODE_122_length_17611_cov_47.044655_9_plen_38_part_00